ncbi:MAG: Glutathione S-transferase [Myxococcaceae bacterium]|nr:Glutathione S-transferase [Myxococcaceae bacterium]
MDELELTIFDYNYSSWSMRAGVLLRATGLPFREAFHSLEAERAQVGDFSPSGLVPVLRHGRLQIWDSLAIAEYLAELCPEQPLWPREREARAIARAASAEMHSGFMALRSAMPMNIRARYAQCPRSPEVERNVARIKALWRELRARFGQGGPFLCGELGIVDAMFVPVVMRFRSYAVKLDATCEAYAEALLAHPAVQGWLARAAAETTRVAAYEYRTD